jgi:hypothetical protein
MHKVMMLATREMSSKKSSCTILLNLRIDLIQFTKFLCSSMWFELCVYVRDVYPRTQNAGISSYHFLVSFPFYCLEKGD